MSIFNNFIEKCKKEKCLILQPRMGFSSFKRMRAGLIRVKNFGGPSIGTITLDSFTRQNKINDANRFIRHGIHLNGYPIVSYPTAKNRLLLKGIRSPEFPVQVRHGSPDPRKIFKALIEAKIDSTEGGPVSYCLPYGRISLKDSVSAWEESSKMFADHFGSKNQICHLETFGGCMMGQLCPPAILNTIAILEALFFKNCGIKSVSLSYAQGSNYEQDMGSILALRELADLYLKDVFWHVVVYTFMGKFPKTMTGVKHLVENSATLAKQTHSERLIVKTVSEAYGIPTISDNLQAMYWALKAPESHDMVDMKKVRFFKEEILTVADYLIKMVLNLSNSLPESILLAFEKGYLDIPYCLHVDNKQKVSACVDNDGCIIWSDIGNLPLPKNIKSQILISKNKLTAADFLKMLSFSKDKYDDLSFITINKDKIIYKVKHMI